MTFEQTLFRLSEENGTFEISSYALESTEAFAANLPQSGYDALILALPSGPIGLDFVRKAASLPMRQSPAASTLSAVCLCVSSMPQVPQPSTQ